MLLAACVVALALAACGGGDDGSTSATSGENHGGSLNDATSSNGGNAGSLSTPIGGGATPAPGTVGVATAGGRQILTDGAGFTLYISANDAPDAGTSACNASCTQIWPPFVVLSVPPAPAGVLGTFGTITRRDGSVQATYNGKPLYRFLNDDAPGDTNGDGFGQGVWTAATP
jgi:predicted lipoprotein with Yx(FWY)xxD motif